MGSNTLERTSLRDVMFWKRKELRIYLVGKGNNRGRNMQIIESPRRGLYVGKESEYFAKGPEVIKMFSCST